MFQSAYAETDVPSVSSAALARLPSRRRRQRRVSPLRIHSSRPAPQYSANLKVGDTAPAFALQGSDGKVHKLSDYKGKTVVLAWFPKAFTGG